MKASLIKKQSQYPTETAHVGDHAVNPIEKTLSMPVVQVLYVLCARGHQSQASARAIDDGADSVLSLPISLHQIFNIVNSYNTSQL